MNYLEYILLFVIILIIFEIFIYLFIKYFRHEFQWLITKEDECPKFNDTLLKKFIENSYEPELGWVRKENSEGFDKGKNGPVKYCIDAIGSRTIYDTQNYNKPFIASFGDSYTFCRQVNDSQTWQALMSERLNSSVLNFGVGNYGLDQAIIRYNKTELPDSIKVVIMGIVPETICRIHSYWKHYFEFGNTLAFKPRYILKNNKPVLIDNIMRNTENFYKLSDKLSEIQSNDEFYIKKFKSQQFRFLYIYSFFRHPVRNFLIFYYLLKRKLFNRLSIVSSHTENAPFSVIMKYNILYAQAMYQEKKYCALLMSLILKFKEDAILRGHKPLLLVMPQLIDLELTKGSVATYEAFFKLASKEIDVIDLTNKIKENAYIKLYTEDSYGGHFSAKGNEFVSNEILSYLKK